MNHTQFTLECIEFDVATCEAAHQEKLDKNPEYRMNYIQMLETKALEVELQQFVNIKNHA